MHQKPTQMSYQRINLIFGWIVFLIATFVYVSTIEPTASFWDCGEFIATAYKLEVGHPPGAPLFMMLGRFFSMFSSPENAAMMVNILSALCSSFTILFLFWTITYLAKKLALQSGELTSGKIIAIIGSGVVGGLAYTFSDSFWFSAVEGEVYAMSSLFTAVVFWAILRWEAVADQPYANRWLILIAYLMGLSIGVHLLNLLAIPAITFVYYFKKHSVSRKGLLWTSVISVLILGIVQAGIIPWTVILASKFELLFVNSFGMPFNSGLIVYIILVIAALVWGIKYTYDKGKVAENTIIVCLAVILLGYSSFALIAIRSTANPPMDENNPENAFTLLSYLNREQYGDRPLLYGHYFNSPFDNSEPYEDGKPVYVQDKKTGKYIISDDKKASIPNYADEFCSVFPRMYSSESGHVAEYKRWTDFKGNKKRYRTISGETEMIAKPTFGENLTFFVKYQIGWMYWRYFMWNFSGRQNDIQGHGDILDGNWITGIPFIDETFLKLGPQTNLPASLSENPARNVFFMLPFLLGVIGLIYQLGKSKEDTFIVFLLFLLTGLAIVVYLNQYPHQPRERDYAYSGSFYAYAIWIGLGVMGITEFLRKYIPHSISATITALLCLVLVPGIMAKEGWDDHDRSDTYTARDFAKNYLDSCAPNAILFTNGDNDTFPLWYVQEVEEYRTDVRVCNLSLLNTDWYIDQMKRKAYDSDPVPYEMPQEKYIQGTRDYVPIIKKGGKDLFLDVKEAIKFISDEKNQATFGADRKMNYFPTNQFSLTVDSAKVVQNGSVPKGMEGEIVKSVDWTINKSYILKNDMMILDMLANFNWDRPVYFAITTGNSSYIGLQDHFQLEGLAYRLIPVKSKNGDGQTGRVNTEIMAKNLISKFAWGGMDATKKTDYTVQQGDSAKTIAEKLNIPLVDLIFLNKDIDFSNLTVGNTLSINKPQSIYMNENNRRMCMNLRNNFSRLAENLIEKGDTKKAIEVLDRCMEVMPETNVPFNYFLLPVAEAYYKANAYDKANHIVRRLFSIYEEEMEYYFALDGPKYTSIASQVQQSISILYRLNSLTNQVYKQAEIGKELNERFSHIQAAYGQRENLLN